MTDIMPAIPSYVCRVRYRGIAKNGAQVFSLLALANLVSRPQDTCVRPTTPGHPLPPAAVSWRL